MKLAMIGVGKLGQDCAEVLAEFYPVRGYDLQPRSPQNVEMAPDIASAVSDADYIFVAVPTPHEPGYGGEAPTSQLEPRDFDYTILENVAEELARCVRDEQTIIIISTTLPGTIRGRIKPILNHQRLIYNPYLIAMGSVKWDMRNPEMIIMGYDRSADEAMLDEVLEIYRPLLENSPRVVKGTWEEAEATKIFYNTFISAKIGLVNMVLDVAEKCGNINVDIVTGALRDSTQRIMGPRYMHAGMGDAGACHPRDNIALRHLAQKFDLGYDLFEAIMTSREKQAENLASRIVALSSEHGLPIVIHGKAYKPLVSYIEGSYSLLVEHFITAGGGTVEYVDPMTGDARVSEGPAVFLLAHDAKITYSNTGVDTSAASSVYCDFPRGSIIVDPWRTTPQIEGVTVIPYGNTRI